MDNININKEQVPKDFLGDENLTEVPNYYMKYNNLDGKSIADEA